jgi:hypothetical protein
VTGELIGRLLDGEAPPFDLAAYSIARF